MYRGPIFPKWKRDAQLLGCFFTIPSLPFPLQCGMVIASTAIPGHPDRLAVSFSGRRRILTVVDA